MRPLARLAMRRAPSPQIPSLRAQRSNPESLRGGSLDCFAALAMTECGAPASLIQLSSQIADALAPSRGMFRPSSASSHRPHQDKGAGKAGCRLAPAIRALEKMHTGWITGDAGRPAFPARMVLTVSFVLSPGSDALLPPSHCGWLMRAPGRAATSPQGLTHRPRASGPHDFSVRGRPHRTFLGWRVLTQDANEAAVTAPCRAARVTSSRFPALPSHIAPTLPRPPQPGPHLVTIAKRPFDGPR